MSTLRGSQGFANVSMESLRFKGTTTAGLLAVDPTGVVSLETQPTVSTLTVTGNTVLAGPVAMGSLTTPSVNTSLVTAGEGNFNVIRANTSYVTNQIVVNTSQPLAAPYIIAGSTVIPDSIPPDVVMDVSGGLRVFGNITQVNSGSTATLGVVRTQNIIAPTLAEAIHFNSSSIDQVASLQLNTTNLIDTTGITVDRVSGLGGILIQNGGITSVNSLSVGDIYYSGDITTTDVNSNITTATINGVGSNPLVVGVGATSYASVQKSGGSYAVRIYPDGAGAGLTAANPLIQTGDQVIAYGGVSGLVLGVDTGVTTAAQGLRLNQSGGVQVAGDLNVTTAGLTSVMVVKTGVGGPAVGINKPNPAYTLDVNGTGNFSNSLSVGGIIPSSTTRLQVGWGTGIQDWAFSSYPGIDPLGQYWPSMIGRGMVLNNDNQTVTVYSTGGNAFGAGMYVSNAGIDLLTSNIAGGTVATAVGLTTTVRMSINPTGDITMKSTNVNVIDPIYNSNALQINTSLDGSNELGTNVNIGNYQNMAGTGCTQYSSVLNIQAGHSLHPLSAMVLTVSDVSGENQIKHFCVGRDSDGFGNDQNDADRAYRYIYTNKGYMSMTVTRVESIPFKSTIGAGAANFNEALGDINFYRNVQIANQLYVGNELTVGLNGGLLLDVYGGYPGATFNAPTGTVDTARVSINGYLGLNATFVTSTGGFALCGNSTQTAITEGLVIRNASSSGNTHPTIVTVTASGQNSNAMVFDATNNRVGINQGSPQYTLDVNGTGRFSNLLAQSPTTVGAINPGNGQFLTIEAYSSTNQATKYPVCLAAYGGGVNIGTPSTSTGGNALYVNGPGYYNGNLTVNNQLTITNLSSYRVNPNWSNDSNIFPFDGYGTPYSNTPGPAGPPQQLPYPPFTIYPPSGYSWGDFNMLLVTVNIGLGAGDTNNDSRLQPGIQTTINNTATNTIITNSYYAFTTPAGSATYAVLNASIPLYKGIHYDQNTTLALYFSFIGGRILLYNNDPNNTVIVQGLF
jgi:hypothetical protein